MESIRKRHNPLCYILWGIGGTALAATAAFVFGLILMLLWNWLMPTLFGLPTITFWQAWGLILMSHILFKSGPHGHPKDEHHGGFYKKFRERFKNPRPHNEPGDILPEAESAPDNC